MGKKIGLILLLGLLSTTLMFNSLVTNQKEMLVLSDSIAYSENSNFNELFYKDNKKEIVEYNDTYEINNITIRDLYDLIIRNEVSGENKSSIQQLINTSEIIVISIGIDEIRENMNINIYLYYMDLVLDVVRKINDNDIFLIGLYSYKYNVNDINTNLINLCKKHKINYVDIESVMKEDYIIEDGYIPNVYGQEIIYKSLNNEYKKVQNIEYNWQS